MNTKDIESQYCACSAGKGSCAHVAALIYQIAHYKTLNKTAVPEVLSKTSCPQSYHIPAKMDGIKPRPVSDVSFVKPNASKSQKEQSEACICSTLYNPVTTAFPDKSLLDGIRTLLPMCDPNLQIFKILPPSTTEISLKETVFGNVYFGSTLSHQLPEPKSDGSIMRISSGPDFPQLPLPSENLKPVYQTALSENESLFIDSLNVTVAESLEIEAHTRLQSQSSLWHRLRNKRLTASVFKDIVVRQKDFDTLVDRLVSSKKIQTAAMKHGLDHENDAAVEYSTHKLVNIRACGFVINPDAPFLGASPDRIVYDPSELNSFGLLEIKCPLKDSYKESSFLKENGDGTYSLRQSHAYYTQIIGQLAITGLKWCDLCVWTKNDMHIERIHFCEAKWKEMFEKLCVFFFDHFMKKFV